MWITIVHITKAYNKHCNSKHEIKITYNTAAPIPI